MINVAGPIVNTEDIKEEVDDFVKTHPETKLDTRGYSNTSRSDQYTLANAEPLHHIFDFLKGIVENTINKKLKFNNAWTIYGYEWNYHALHHHVPHGAVNTDFNEGHSSVLYLSTPENTEQEDADARGFFYIVDQGSNEKWGHGNVLNHKPSVGELVIFPTSALHGVHPQAKGLRHMLNIDYEVQNV